MAQPTLRRAVGRWQIVGLAMNDVIGSGIYLLPAAAAALLGPWSVGAVALAGFAVLLIVLCFAEAATHFDEPGSAYLYARTAFGDLVGFQVGWMTWLTRVASVASLAAGFAQALAFLWPGANAGMGRTLTIILSLVALYLVNVIGVRSGARTAVVLAVGKVIPLLIFIAVGAFAFSTDRFLGQAVTQEGGLGAAALLLLYAYAGFENTAAAAGEFKNPQRDVPFALLTHIGLVTALYVLVQLMVLGVLDHVGGSETPLADASQLLLGSAGGLLLTVGAAVSIFGTNANTVFSGPRYLFALARDGYFPAKLAEVHPRFRTPAVALTVQTLLALPLALHGSFVHLATLSVVARLVTYLGTTLAVPVLRRKMPPRPGAFRLPGGPTIPIVATGLGIVFATRATAENLQAAGVALLVGLVIYGIRGRRT